MAATTSKSSEARFRLIPDQYRTHDELSKALRLIGFENCDVVLAIDFTGSNRDQGAKTFGGRDLHHPHETILAAAKSADPTPTATTATTAATAPPAYAPSDAPPGGPPAYAVVPSYAATAAAVMNPYEAVMSAMSSALETLSPAGRITVVGFGDSLTEDHSIFCVKKRAAGQLKASVVNDMVTDCEPCEGTAEVLSAYRRALPYTVKSGPTSFVPLLEKLSDRVRRTRRYCFLFIVGDGAVSDKGANAAAVVAASRHPISVSMIGVGDGPWDAMEEFDDALPARKFDNWQFLPYHTKMHECNNNPLRFAVHALMEMPDQLRAIKRLGYLA